MTLLTRISFLFAPLALLILLSTADSRHTLPVSAGDASTLPHVAAVPGAGNGGISLEATPPANLLNTATGLVRQSNDRPPKGLNQGVETITSYAVGIYHYNEGYQEDWRVEALIEWVEAPDFLFGCNCRVFFPEGSIGWTWDYGWFSDYSDPPCQETDFGQLSAPSPPNATEQMLILWEDPQNEDQYYYSGYGYIPVTWFSECENGERGGLSYFPNIPPPDIFPENADPALPPQSPAGDTSPLCSESEFTVPRSGTDFLYGECCEHFDTVSYLCYIWSFSLGGGGTTPTPTPTPTPSTAPTPAPTPPVVLKGDYDCDGDVDAVDALTGLRMLAALPLQIPPDCEGPRDIDCDGDIDAVDMLLILRSVAGLPPNLPIGCEEMGV